MKFNKTLVAALLLGFTLTGCNDVVQKDEDQDANTPTVEENTANEEAVETTEDDAEETVETTDDDKENADEEATDETEEVESEDSEIDEEESETATTDTSNMTVEEKRTMLEEAIFENRSRARAAELLLEMTPEKVADIAPQLEQLIEESNALLEKAQLALDQLDAQ